MAGEWLTSRNVRGSKRKREDGAEAFSNDWGSYECGGGGRGGEGGGGGRFRKPQRGGSAAAVALPHSLSSSGGAGVGGSAPRIPVRALSPYGSGTASSGFRPIAGPGGGGSGLNASTLRLSARNPQPTVRVPDDGTLNAEQRLVVESVLSGYSTFFTGPAGTGKSHVISSILRFNDEGSLVPKKRIVVTATTGLAACNIGGTTIHSFSGIGTGEGTLEQMAAKVMGNQYAKKRWREVDILIVDEVSMLSGGFFDKLNFIASRARNDQRPFGGVQVILCGDFYQLPPVNLEKSTFAFMAKCWPKVIQSSVLLKQIFRQNGDAVLCDILNEARIGELSDNSAEVLRTHSMFGSGRGQRALAFGGSSEPLSTAGAGLKPTLLECRNREVDKANNLEMAKLSGETMTYHSRDRAVSKAHESQLKSCSAVERLELKVGAQVILLKNIDPERGLVNGSRGVVVEFRHHPKSNNDMPREFKKLELPVVCFDSGGIVGRTAGDDGKQEDDDDERTKIIEPAEWTNRVGDDVVSSRIQIPLRLAWSLSVHKSQGMTIPNLTVSLNGVFEYGRKCSKRLDEACSLPPSHDLTNSCNVQCFCYNAAEAYVALSRATKLSLLQLRGFRPDAFRAHPLVKQFYQLLEESQAMCPSNPAKGCGGSRKQSAAEPISQDKAVTATHITDEQRQRMEENRRRALAIKKQRQNEMQLSGRSGISPNPYSK